MDIYKKDSTRGSSLCEATVQGRTLHALRFSMREVINADLQLFRHDFDVEEASGCMGTEIGNVLVASVRAHVFAEQLEGSEVQYPKTWWQAFKKQYFPKFLLARYPVRYTKVRVSFDVLYPEYTPVLPDHQYVVHVRSVTDNDVLCD